MSTAANIQRALQPQTADVVVRPATPDDFLEMAEHGREWWLQTEFSRHIPYDPASIVESLHVLADSKMLLVAEAELDIVGFVGGIVVPLYVNAAYKVGMERFWWVHPDYRRSGVGAQLLAGIEAAAKAAGCTLWSMIAMQCMDPERAGTIYESAGYHWTERTYTKELQ